MIAARFAEIGTDIDANDMIELTTLSKVQSGGSPGSIASSVRKIQRSLRQAISELAALVVGTAAIRWEERRPLHELARELLR